ncbi:MAG: SDR family NAD(P)-dependent oxidoreductase [Alkalispirochaeta sp.]
MFPIFSLTTPVLTLNPRPLPKYPDRLRSSRKTSFEVIEVNLTGTFLACQAIGGAMAEAGRGSIINVGSIYGMLSPVQDIYA